MNHTKRRRRSTAWRFCCAAALLIAAATFTPLVIPPGRHTPSLAGLPFTLWAGALVSVAFVLLTYVASRVHPDARSETSESDEGRKDA